MSTTPSPTMFAPVGDHNPYGVVGFADRVLEIAKHEPERTAMIHAHHRPLGSPSYERFEYGELSRRAEHLALGLRTIGVEEGTRCSFMVPPGFESLVLGVALWRVGAVIVGIEPHSHGLRNVGRCLVKAEPEVFIGTPLAFLARRFFGWGRPTVHTEVMAASHARPGMPTLRSLEARGAELARGSERIGVAPAVSPDDTAIIAFTTGSTGAPKPTLMRHRNVAAMIDQVSQRWGLVDGEVIDMPTFPMFWVIGLSVGGTVVVPPMDFIMKGPGEADPRKLLRTIDDCGVRSMFASPALLTNLSGYANAHGIKTPTIERIVAGGAEVPGPLFAAVREMLGGTGEIYSDYGATEALPVTEIAGAEVVSDTWPATERGAGVCVGTPMPNVEIRVVAIDDDTIPSWDAATELAVGQIGELVARGPHISEEYVNQPEATAANKIPDPTGTWHRIGDTGYVDAQGRAWVCGRRSHRVVTTDGVVYPLCCEPVFNAHPSVARSALVGVDAGDGTQRAVLCVERAKDGREDATTLERELMELAQSIESTRLIDRVHFIDTIPVDRRHNAKIDRPGLAKHLSDQR